MSPPRSKPMDYDQKLDSIVLFDGTATYDLQVEVVNTDAVYT